MVLHDRQAADPDLEHPLSDAVRVVVKHRHFELSGGVFQRGHGARIGLVRDGACDVSLGDDPDDAGVFGDGQRAHLPVPRQPQAWAARPQQPPR